ncbi:XcyI restriction endonuclease [Aquimarina sp. MAR_2010_214]|uniref:XcyI family restriction endonuclease n=1 Tax=Aquimarina sp. MAR_2010_214 TaxID=1250026 RepID=UPI000C7037B1|nr:XcyI family restriction endonuclease [Aquimarina sp. MAR_2010_214]PKV50442.1 XcyI restriction endonuclease [Aquimarina sp. MAR_2010_214]
MAKIPKEIEEESYLLKSTFFFRKLNDLNYVGIDGRVKKAAAKLKDDLNWEGRSNLGISEEAWSILKSNEINPCRIFVHPTFLRTYPSLLKYYRCLAMIPQKGLMKLVGIGSLKDIEEKSKDIPESKISSTVKTLNEFISSVLTINGWYKEECLKAMVYSTAGTTIDGSWRNKIGEEGERVVKEILVKALLKNNEVSYFIMKNDDKIEFNEFEQLDKIDELRSIFLTNSYSIVFRSEPDGTILSPSGEVTGGIEVKAGIDPAAALERLGAMFKSFDNIKQTYPKAQTVLVASCLTNEVEARIRESQAVNFTFMLTDITMNKRSVEARFVNKIREMCGLIHKRL